MRSFGSGYDSYELDPTHAIFRVTSTVHSMKALVSKLGSVSYSWKRCSGRDDVKVLRTYTPHHQPPPQQQQQLDVPMHPQPDTVQQLGVPMQPMRSEEDMRFLHQLRVVHAYFFSCQASSSSQFVVLTDQFSHVAFELMNKLACRGFVALPLITPDGFTPDGFEADSVSGLVPRANLDDTTTRTRKRKTMSTAWRTSDLFVAKRVDQPVSTEPLGDDAYDSGPEMERYLAGAYDRFHKYALKRIK
jgi:hypothetical protein